MKRITPYLISLALASSASVPALAQGPPTGMTRAEVVSELLEAQRNGDTIVNGQTGQTARDMRPDLYPATSGGPGKTRAEVIEELREAQRNGETIVNGETGQTARELRPDLYPSTNNA